MPHTSTPRITVTLITYNEEALIAGALASVAWADEVIVVDSGSTDQTRAIAEKAGARVFSNPWPGYGQQKNFAHSQARGEWVLNIDADERVSPELRQEMVNAIAEVEAGRTAHAGFSFPRKTYYLGRWIRYGGWYPNRLTRITRRVAGRWSEPPVHERLEIQGSVGALSAPLDHYTFASIEAQVEANLRYARLGSALLRERGGRANILKLLLKPWGKFMETYFLKQGFRDGIAGLIIAINAAYSVFMKYAFLFDERIRVAMPGEKK